MRLLFISQLFDPEYSIKGLGFVSELSGRGVEVDVITTFPNYPTGKVFEGYKVKPWQVEFREGVRIVRVYSYISHSKSKYLRALSYLSFMLSAFIACLFLKKPNAIYAYHPQLTTGFIAIFFKWARGIPFITDVQDLWPDALAATGLQRDGHLYRFLSRLCRFVYQQAAQIVVLSVGYRIALLERGVSADKISVVYNWHADESLSKSALDKRLLPVGYKYSFVYAGNLGAAQSLRPAIEAFSKLKPESVNFVIIGAGVEKLELEQYAKSISADNVFFLGYIPSKNIKPYLSEADILFVHLRDEDLFKITIPSKVQAYLSSGKPILMAVGGESNQIVLEARAGEVALPGNAESIANAARELLLKKEQWPAMGANGRAYYDREMTRTIGVDKIISILSAAGR